MLRPIWIDDGSPIPDPFGYGERAVQWLRRRKHPKNPAPGSPFTLDPWQERIIRRIYGPRDADGRRIVREVFLGLPRGNRKTSLSAAITLLHLCGPEMIPGGHLVSAASTRKQARECFEEAAMIVNADKRWRGKLRVTDHKNQIRFTATGARYEAISADAGGAHGSTLALAIVDELHAHKNPHLWQAVRTGTAKVPNSLRVIATTAGAGTENVCCERWNYARRVQLGEIEDPHFLPVIFAAEEGDDWRDEAVWHRVNPGLAHGYPDLAALRDHAREAEHVLSERHAFQQFHLNLWQEHSDAPFVEMATYDEGHQPVDLEALRGLPCWIGVDLSSNLDLTAVVACWKDPAHEYGYVVHPWYFIPAERIDGRKMKGDEFANAYRRWTDAGLITATPGNVVDYRAVQAAIFDICDQFDVRQIGIDPWRAQSTMQALLDKGLPVVEFRQGAASMVPAIAELERAILAKRFAHGRHPVLRWNFQNIRTVRNKNDNIEFHKQRSVDKIDGAVAAAMAVKLAFDSDMPTPIIDNADALKAFYGLD